MVAVHIASGFLDADGQRQLILWFGFIPLRLGAFSTDAAEALPLLWTPITHAFLHGGWEHLILNVAWLAIFGTLVARRYGSLATVGLFLLSAIAGAAAFALTSYLRAGQGIADRRSGGVAGLTGAAVRFIFQPVLFGKAPGRTSRSCRPAARDVRGIVAEHAGADIHADLGDPQRRGAADSAVRAGHGCGHRLAGAFGGFLAGCSSCRCSSAAMAETDDLKERLEKLEMLAAEQERVIEDLNQTITAQWREIEALKRQIAKLDDELREVEAGLPAPPIQKPPHY